MRTSELVFWNLQVTDVVLVLVCDFLDYARVGGKDDQERPEV